MTWTARYSLFRTRTLASRAWLAPRLIGRLAPGEEEGRFTTETRSTRRRQGREYPEFHIGNFKFEIPLLLFTSPRLRGESPPSFPQGIAHGPPDVGRPGVPAEVGRPGRTGGQHARHGAPDRLGRLDGPQ